MKKLLLIVLPLLLIVGCSKPVEDSTLINKDGLMYLPDSDTPYTGEVYFKYDTGEKEYQGTYENGLLIEYSYLNKDGTVKEPVNGETLIDRGGLFYEVNGQKPYTGDVFELYNEGNKKYTGALKGGEKDKFWTEWFENGNKRNEGKYNDGKKDGKWTYWSPYGPMSIEMIYKDGNYWDGLDTYWHENGKKKKEVTYKDGKEIGRTEWEYYENSQMRYEGTFKDGLMNGVWTYYYENGNIDGQGEFLNGDEGNISEVSGIPRNGRNGVWVFYFENGQKQSEETFKSGELDGLWTWWFENGQKKREGTIKDGEIDGLVTAWYNNGQKQSEETFKNGELDGRWTSWHENGQKEFEITFKDGELVEEKMWDEDGTLVKWANIWGAEAKSVIGYISNGVDMFYQTNGKWPTSVEDLVREGKLDLKLLINAKWVFELQLPGKISATSTEEMVKGAGKTIVFNRQTGRFTGYSSPKSE